MSKRVCPACRCLGALTIFFSPYLPAAFAGEKWMDLMPFPEPHEEVIGQAANGKMYVFAGLVSVPVWQPVGMVYEYDPPANKWTKKKVMPLPAKHLALTEYNGKVYVFGGFIAGRVGNLTAWAPINTTFEYDPANDFWKELAPMPTKRGAGVAATVGDKMYVIGGATVAPGATNPAIHPTTPQRVVGTVEERRLRIWITSKLTIRQRIPGAFHWRRCRQLAVVCASVFMMGASTSRGANGRTRWNNRLSRI